LAKNRLLKKMLSVRGKKVQRGAKGKWCKRITTLNISSLMSGKSRFTYRPEKELFSMENISS